MKATAHPSVKTADLEDGILDLSIKPSTPRESPIIPIFQSSNEKRTISIPIPSTKLLLKLLLSLRPRFLLPHGLHPAHASSKTTYLASLRGIAALFVYNAHHQPFRDSFIWNLPFASVLLSGKVDTFFIISGYCLSYRPLELIRSQDSHLLLDCIASSVFRRFIRLYGTVAIATFISMLLVRFELARPVARTSTFSEQFGDWLAELVHFCNVFAPVDTGYHRGTLTNRYLSLVWTVAVEFRGSVIVYLFCMGTCKLAARFRMALAVGVVALAYYWGIPYVALFIGGLFFADLSFERHPPPPPHSGTITTTTTTKKPASPTPTTKLDTSERIFYALVLAAALVLLGVKGEINLDEEYWYWPLLSLLTPQMYMTNKNLFAHWWTSIGGFLLIWALDSHPGLQAPLHWHAIRCLGDISFGIYLTHFMVLWVFTEQFLNPWRIYLVGPEAMWPHIPALAINFVAVIWAGDVFARVDRAVTMAARWLQRQVFIW